MCRMISACLVALLFVAGSAQAQPLTIVAFGDSTTAIRSTIDRVYAQRLPASLSTAGVAARVHNAGIGGSHTGHRSDNARHAIDHALDRFERAVRERKPDLVVIQFGWNDSWVDSRKEGDAPRISLEAYRGNLDQMISTLKKDGAVVILMTPNRPHKEMAGWQVDLTGSYAAAARALAQKHKLTLLDIWQEYQRYDMQPNQDSDHLLLDSVHPNDKGQELVSRLLRTEILAKVKAGQLPGGQVPLASLPRQPPHQLVADGKADGVQLEGSGWRLVDEGVEGADSKLLIANHIIHAGDFRVRAELRMLNQEASAASFFFGRNHFGFEGASRTVYLSGPMFGGVKLLGTPTEFFKRGEWIEFEAVRAGSQYRFSIKGQLVHVADGDRGRIDMFGFNPMRSTMQVRQLSFHGSSEVRPRSLPAAYTIPTLDLSGQTDRQVMVDREPGQYLGHPTTVLLEDNKTILCVYPKGHGRGAICYKRSADAGLTWSERIPTPASWSTSKEVPTIHRVVDADGTKRLIVFSGLYPVRMAVSEDDGQKWSELKAVGDFGGIVTMGCVEALQTGDGHYMALFHDDGRFFKGTGRASTFYVYKTLSVDGGLTWGEPEIIATHSSAHLCEPGIIRSPNGKQLAVLLRENSRRHNSFVVFSNDEGKTWSEPRELPAALTGDRHTGKYGPDGRLFISFRDTTRSSPTKGDWVGWVGRYEDIVKGREGQYRVRLMDNHNGGDCAYPGVEILPDGTFVTTTYGHWIAGEEPFIMSVRLKLSELDEMADRKTGAEK